MFKTEHRPAFDLSDVIAGLRNLWLNPIRMGSSNGRFQCRESNMQGVKPWTRMRVRLNVRTLGHEMNG
jgi:hypothetical protein